MTWYDSLWFFIIYAVLGWCTEVAYAAAKTGHFVNRGFLNGPYCPIYGFGALTVLVVLSPIADNPILLFLGSVVLTTALEFFGGFLLERFFHEKWWDYSAEPFNIRGYICLRFSLLWGMACMIVVDAVHPWFALFTAWFPEPAGIAVLCVVYALVTADLVVTVANLLQMRRHLHTLRRLGDELRKLSDALGEHISDGVLETQAIGENVQAHTAQSRLRMQEELRRRRDYVETERQRMQEYA